MLRFDGKVVLITGSDSGIGQELAVAFAREGALVCVHGISDEAIQSTVLLLKENDVDESRYTTVKGFLQEDGVFTDLIDATIQKFKKLDILINNAGIVWSPGSKHTTEFDPEVMDQLYQVNLRAPFALTELAIPHLKKSQGCIICTSSIAGVHTSDLRPELSIYGITKAALLTFTKYQSQRLAPFGIRVNAMLPGIHDSPFIRRTFNNLKTEADQHNFQKYVDSVSERIPVKTIGKVPDLVQSYLLMAESPVASGALWIQDGGRCGFASEGEHPYT